MRLLAHLVALAVLPIVLIGLINRTRARWSGRRGPPLLQSAWDLIRLARKTPVVSEVTTELFRLGPLVMLSSTVVSALLIPLFGGPAPLHFEWDFVAVAYLWALGRIFTVLGALDTGSAFEGMGASREATWAALAEPGLFLALGTLAAATGHSSFSQLLHPAQVTPGALVIRVCCAVALFLILQIEAGRVPVDDPATHLELTMIHEVMILDHSGPELAALQLGAALKLTICSALVAALLNPLGAADPPLLVAAVNVALMGAVAIAVGFVESLTARLQLKVVPLYVGLASLAGLVALLSFVADPGGAR